MGLLVRLPRLLEGHDHSTQLKQYEDAVIQKRFEELEDDEVDALLGEIERESAL